MNLILFDGAEIERPLDRTDPRSVHLLQVLRRSIGDRFDAGIVNGPRGKGTVTAVDESHLFFGFEATAQPFLADSIDLVVALPRPQTARKILNEATSLGITSFRFFSSEKGEASYAASRLWTTPEWRRHLMEGAAQAFDTRLPEVRHFTTLDDAVASLPSGGFRTALDNYEGTQRMEAAGFRRPLALAFGPERGWSAAERGLLRARGFGTEHLGSRVLRTETAIVAALALAKAGS